NAFGRLRNQRTGGAETASNVMDSHFQRLPDISQLSDVTDLIEKFKWKRQSEPWLETVHLVALALLHTHQAVVDLPKSLEILTEAEKLQNSPNYFNFVDATYLIKTARLRIKLLQSCNGFPVGWKDDVAELEAEWGRPDTSAMFHGSIGWIKLRLGYSKLFEVEDFLKEANAKEPENFLWLFGLAIVRSRIRRNRDFISSADGPELKLWEKAEASASKPAYDQVRPLFQARYAEAIISKDQMHSKCLELVESASNSCRSKTDPGLVETFRLCLKVCRILWDLRGGKNAKSERTAEENEIIRSVEQVVATVLKFQPGESHDSPDFYDQVARWHLSNKNFGLAIKNFRKAAPERNIWAAKYLIDLIQDPAVSSADTESGVSLAVFHPGIISAMAVLAVAVAIVATDSIQAAGILAAIVFSHFMAC
ncbi:hypothetical protein BOX15_Mlig011244g1, partial [Macrostomum lignano]